MEEGPELEQEQRANSIKAVTCGRIEGSFFELGGIKYDKTKLV